MAKKEKVALTPEELKAKKERTAEKRKIFGDTFIKSLAVLLSFVLVYTIVYIAFGQGRVVSKQVNAPVNSNSSSNNSSNNSSSNNSSNNNSNDSSNPAASSDSNQNADPSTQNEAETVAKLINDATAKIVNEKVGYKWNRNCEYTTPIDVGSATGTLNKVIHMADENADLDSVVGGFLGVGLKEADIPKGADAAETIDYHGTSYAIKATSLKGSDLNNLQKNGDTYTFTLADADTPAKDNSTSFSRFTNDIIIQSEVDAEIKQYVSVVSVNSLSAKYTNIKVSVTLKDGQITALTYNWAGDAALGLKALGIPINGTGAIKTEAKYSNFEY